MKVINYKNRIIDKKIDEYLKLFGAICVEGPKWCGKTWTSLYHSKSSFLIADPSNDFQNRKLANLSMQVALEGEFPHLIDEWQELPEIWDAVRYKVDELGEKGCYILTGSSTPKIKGVLHSGAGRIAHLRMNTMSLYESGNSSGDISLKDLCYNENLTSKKYEDVSLDLLMELIIRGGFPQNIQETSYNVLKIMNEYIEGIVKYDLSRIDNKNRNYSKVSLLLKSLARNESTFASKVTLQKDIKESDNDDIDINTISDYIDSLQRVYLIDDIAPFGLKIRSRDKVRLASKHHFVDTSIPCSILNITKEKLINELDTFGLLFESMCIRDLKVYADSFNAKVYHYHDYNDNEIDAVIELDNGEWCAFEIKLGVKQIDEAAKSLLHIKNIIEREGKKAPKVMCIISGLSNYSYKRDDGIYVIPILALKN